MVAVYSDTNNQGEKVIIGYLNVNQLAEPGEHRIYSTDASGALQAYVWCKADGKLRLNGSADNAVRYTSLNTGAQNFKTAVQAELAKIAIGITGVGGSYTPGTLTIDISDSKVDTVLLP
jgi:hypothetical protein